MVLARSWTAVGDALIGHYAAVLSEAARAAPRGGSRRMRIVRLARHGFGVGVPE
jgi:hypothetical protein